MKRAPYSEEVGEYVRLSYGCYKLAPAKVVNALSCYLYGFRQVCKLSREELRELHSFLERYAQ